MFCKNCGNNLSDQVKFCSKCGNAIGETTQTVVSNVASSEQTSQTTIKCGNCDYVGLGEPARSWFGVILAWLCVIFAPLITIIYFLATSKYRCPKCKSTFIGY